MLSAGGLTFRRRCSYGSQETGEPHRRFSATVQTMACFKCQKPELAGTPRHRILRPEADNGLLSNAACGDGLYAPFPVSTSATAAALALELVLSWNSGNPGHRFRTRVLNSKRSFLVKDMNLTPSDACPTCRRRPS